MTNKDLDTSQKKQGFWAELKDQIKIKTEEKRKQRMKDTNIQKKEFLFEDMENIHKKCFRICIKDMNNKVVDATELSCYKECISNIKSTFAAYDESTIFKKLI